jgi:hypothetical protein
MPKISQGRLDGFSGMSKFTAEELHSFADQYESEINNPKNTDDPKWLQRRADKLRALAIQKEKALDHKSSQKKKTKKSLEPEA